MGYNQREIDKVTEKVNDLIDELKNEIDRLEEVVSGKDKEITDLENSSIDSSALDAECREVTKKYNSLKNQFFDLIEQNLAQEQEITKLTILVSSIQES